MKGGPSALSYWRSSPERFKPACKSWARKFGRVDVSLLGFVFALFLLAAVALASYQSITGLLGRARWVEHTQQVRLQIEELLSLYSSVRIAWRSYLITGDGQQLQEFDAAEKTMSSKIESLRRLTADDPRQQQRFASFFLLVTQDVAAIAESMALKKDGKLTDPADVFQQFTTVKLNVSELGKLAQQMKDEEDALLRNRSRESQRSADQTVFVIIFGNVVSFALLVLAFGLLRREVGQRTAAEQALIKSEQHFRSVAESASDAIISANSLGQIVFWNKAAQRIFGFGREVLGQPLTRLMPERYREAHLNGFRRFLSSGDSHVVGKTLELSALRRDGTEFPMELSLAAWSSQGDIFFTAIVRDITERKQAEDEIKALNAHLELRAAELQATNKQLESFCYSISHDLRSPLRAINGYARILEEDYREKIDDQAERLLKLISDNARKMGQLIDDLLTFARLGRKPVAVANIDMERMARQAWDETRASSGGKPPQLVFKAMPPAWGDQALIYQVWVNLLSNAMKFSARKEAPVIEIGGCSDSLENQYYVRDNGAGFDMQYYKKLFGVFQRLHRADEYPGTGVGLAIVHRVIVRQGGRVWAEGKVDEGATFHFSLPRSQAENGREHAIELNTAA